MSTAKDLKTGDYFNTLLFPRVIWKVTYVNKGNIGLVCVYSDKDYVKIGNTTMIIDVVDYNIKIAHITPRLVSSPPYFENFSWYAVENDNKWQLQYYCRDGKFRSGANAGKNKHTDKIMSLESGWFKSEEEIWETYTKTQTTEKVSEMSILDNNVYSFEYDGGSKKGMRYVYITQVVHDNEGTLYYGVDLEKNEVRSYREQKISKVKSLKYTAIDASFLPYSIHNLVTQHNPTKLVAFVQTNFIKKLVFVDKPVALKFKDLAIGDKFCVMGTTTQLTKIAKIGNFNCIALVNGQAYFTPEYTEIVKL